MAKGRVEIYTEACKSCLYCVNTCPKHVLGTTSAVNSKGYQYAVPVNPEEWHWLRNVRDNMPRRGYHCLQGGELTWVKRYS